MPMPRRYENQAARQAAYRQRRAEARRRELEAKGMPSLPAVATLPGHARWQALTRQALLLLQTVQEERQAYYDQRSERWQESERGAAFLEGLQAVEEARDAVEALLD